MIKAKHMAIFLASLLAAVPMFGAMAAEESDMQQGMEFYHQRRYMSAVERFGCALPGDFNNSNLHYYLANCMVYLHQRGDAIREYRIAFALSPEGTIGKYSKLCLNKFGIDAEGKIEKKKDKEAAAINADSQTGKMVEEDAKQVLKEMNEQKRDGSFYVKNYTADYFKKKQKKNAGQDEVANGKPVEAQENAQDSATSQKAGIRDDLTAVKPGAGMQAKEVVAEMIKKRRKQRD